MSDFNRFDELFAELLFLVEKRMIELNAHVAVFWEIQQKLLALGRAHDHHPEPALFDTEYFADDEVQHTQAAIFDTDGAA